MNYFKLKYFIISLSGLIFPLMLAAQSDSINSNAQFLLPELFPSVIKFKDGTTINAKMNYNILSEKMIFEKENKMYDLVNTEKVDTVFLPGRKFVPMDNIFLEVFSKTGIPLFTQFKGALIPPGKPSGYGGTSQTSSIESIATIYGGAKSYNLKLPSDYSVQITLINWIRVNGKMEKFISERQFIKIFKDKDDQIKGFIKLNKTDFKDRKDIVKLLEFCNVI